MAKKELEFISSNGVLNINEIGIPQPSSEMEDWLLTIGKVDVAELDNYYALNGLGKCESGDVLDFCFWNKDGEYIEADRDWRISTFHPPSLNAQQIVDNVNASFEWIKANRISS